MKTRSICAVLAPTLGLALMHSSTAVAEPNGAPTWELLSPAPIACNAPRGQSQAEMDAYLRGTLVGRFAPDPGGNPFNEIVDVQAKFVELPGMSSSSQSYKARPVADRKEVSFHVPSPPKELALADGDLNGRRYPARLHLVYRGHSICTDVDIVMVQETPSEIRVRKK